MSAFIDLLDEIEIALNTIIGFETVKLSTEVGINAKATPACRIVPVGRQLAPSNYMDQGEIKIVVLLDLKNNVSDMTRQSILFEEEIREVLKPIIPWMYTIYDQDSISIFKSVVLTFKFSSIRNTRTECPTNELG